MAIAHPKPTGYHHVSEKTKQIIDKHLGFMHEICELVSIHNFLIEEIHQKKSVKKRVLWHPQPGRCLFLYKTSLFLGRKMIYFKDWTTDYRGTLEDLLYYEIDLTERNKIDLIAVYYKREYDISIDEDRWKLSDGLETWTETDEERIHAYMQKLRKFTQEKLGLMIKHKLFVKPVRQWTKLIETKFTQCYPME